MIHKVLTTSLVVQLLLITCFLWFGWQADQAMDKSGVGDVDAWNRHNAAAGMAFYGAVLCWLLIIGLAVAGKAFRSRVAQLATALPPLFLILGWCVALLAL